MMKKKKMIRRKCEVCGEEKDATTYLDAWDGVRVVHNVNVGNRGREIYPLSRTQLIQF